MKNANENTGDHLEHTGEEDCPACKAEAAKFEAKKMAAHETIVQHITAMLSALQKLDIGAINVSNSLLYAAAALMNSVVMKGLSAGAPLPTALNGTIDRTQDHLTAMLAAYMSGAPGAEIVDVDGDGNVRHHRGLPN